MSCLRRTLFKMACIFGGASLVVLGQHAASTLPASAPLESQPVVPDPLKHLKVVCTVLPGDKPSQTRVLAFLVNEADRPIPVYVLGFFGPGLWKLGQQHIEPLMITERTSSPENASENIILLRPSSVFGRQYVVDTPLVDFQKDYRASCHYIVYEQKAEGKAQAIRGVIYPDRVDRVGAKGGG
jgi:hypothetical protein